MIKRPLGLLCLAVAAFLYLYVRLDRASDPDYSEFQNEKFHSEMVTVTGKVYKKETVIQANEPVTVLYLKLEKENNTGSRKETTGSVGKNVICYLKSGEPEAEMGCRIQLQGKPASFETASNPGQFDAYSYYQISEISYRLNQAEIKAKTTKYNKLAQGLYRLRVFLSEKMEKGLPEKEASVMQTMLLGEKGSMDKELKDLYQRNGIAHILAISGLHVSMLGMGVYRVFRKCGVPMKAAAGLSMGVMFLYGMMTGFSVSARRAVLMFALQMAAIILERTYDMLTAAAIAAVLILLRQPLYFFHSGFLFSFGCVLGIGLLLPVFTETVKDCRWAVKAAAGGVGMMVITLPVYLWFYYQYPLWSILLNLIVIPLMSLLMAAGLLLLLSQLLFPPASALFALVIKGILGFYEILLELCDGHPGGLLTIGRPKEWQMMVYLLLLLLLIIAGKRLRPAARWCIALAAMGLLFIHPHGKMELTFLDVGQGDCIFIANDNGNSYLVDGGSSSVKAVGEYRIIPFLKYQGVSCLEAVFVTHPDEDHCNGIKELIELGVRQGIQIEHLVLPDIAQETKNQSYLELEQLAEKARIPTLYISRGQEIRDDQLKLSCLHPVKGEPSVEANEYSIVLAVSYGNFNAMLTGDVEGSGEQKLIRFLEEEADKNRLTVLKAAHHGSSYSTPNEFLDSRLPVYTIISCGRNNAYGHPNKELLNRLKAHDTDILITYETGALTFTTDGEKLSLTKFLGG